MKSITQRELRNDSAKVLRAVEQGETFTVTRNGVPVARLGPLADDSGLRVVRPAKQRLDPSGLHRTTSVRTTADVLDELRGER